MNRILIYLAVILITSSCISEVKDRDLPQPETHLVLGCFLSPQDTVIEAYVSKTNLIFANSGPLKDDTLRNATVMIRSSTDTVFLNYKSKNYYHAPIGDFKIEEGKTYYLEANTPDGLSAEATCTIPIQATADLVLVKKDSVPHPYFSQQTLYSLDLEWTDVAGQRNYYNLYDLRAIHTYKNGIFPDTAYPIGFDSYYTYISAYADELILSDKDRDGKKIRVNRINYTVPDYLIHEQEYRALKVNLLHTDEAYYKYHEAVNNYPGEDPFSEPVKVYTNIKGGFGVFSGYTTVTYILPY